MSASLVGWAFTQTTGSQVRKAVLVALADHANGHTGRCDPSVQRMADELEMGYRTVQRALAELAEMGMITRSRLRRDDGSLSRYSYSFPPAAGAGGSAAATLPPAAPAGTTGRSVHSPPAAPAGQEPEVLQPEEEPNASSEMHETTKGAESAPINRVYDHWREARGKTRSSYDKISPARKQKIQARLKEFTEEDLIQAIDNVAKDPWPDRKSHDDILVIFRSREQVERFLEMAVRKKTLVDYMDEMGKQTEGGT